MHLPKDTDLERLYRFVEEHRDADAATLLLKGKFPPGVDASFAALQIEIRKHHRRKLSKFFSINHFLVPDREVVEMATATEVALFNSSTVAKGSTVCDLTSGLGIDLFCLSRQVGDNGRVTGIELDKFRAEILAHNASVLGLQNVRIVNADSIKWLKESDATFDVIFIDPARRSKSGQRFYGFGDSIPSIPGNIKLLRERADIIFIKASPMLDISLASTQLPGLEKIKIVSLMGECKELLFQVRGIREHKAVPNQTSTDITSVPIECIDLSEEGVISYFTPPVDGSLQDVSVSIKESENPLPGSYICQPNAAVMKSGRINSLPYVFHGLKKLDNNTHLFVASEKPENFPGKILQVVSIPDKKAMKQFTGRQLNVVSRNHPLSAAEIEKKYKLKAGDEEYLIACRVLSKPTYLLCRLTTK